MFSPFRGGPGGPPLPMAPGGPRGGPRPGGGGAGRLSLGGSLSSSVRPSCANSSVSQLSMPRAHAPPPLQEVRAQLRHKCTKGKRTKISSAVGEVLSDFAAISSNDLGAGLLFTSRNGFLETGLGDGSSNGEAGLFGREFGETARFRKGLFDARFKVKPGPLPVCRREKSRSVNWPNKLSEVGSWQQMKQQSRFI